MLTVGGSRRVQDHTRLHSGTHPLFVHGDFISTRSLAVLVESRLQSVGIDLSATFHAVQQSPESAWNLSIRIATSLESQSEVLSGGTVEQSSTGNHQAISRNNWRSERARHSDSVGSVFLF